MTVAPSPNPPIGPRVDAAPPAPAKAPRAPRTLRIALLGNPNTGKTTLFNRLSGLRHKTSNFPGTTLDARTGRLVLEDASGQDGRCTLELIDLPGVYSLELDQLEAAVARAVLLGEAAPQGEPMRKPDGVCIVADATNLPRNLVLAGEVLRRAYAERLTAVIAVNMSDIARRRGLFIDSGKLSNLLGCDVIPVSARTGERIDELKRALTDAHPPLHAPPKDESALRAWADDIYAQAASGDPDLEADRLTDRLDRVFTHPVLGSLSFALIMAGLFFTIFKLARYPMDWIVGIFKFASDAVGSVLPPGVLHDLIADGVINGVSATVVFLPQICLLFFLISLLEDTGYLARAAFVMDRLLRPFGLPGHSFVPLLSSHACALPGIMACRGIPDRRERLATILVAPFVTCSARLPVYVLITSLLFRDRPAMAALAFIGCYALGMFAAVTSALIARRTILKGKSRPMALELPTYKLPSLQTALLTTYDRARVFLKKAGTNILAICVVLWWLSNFPGMPGPGAKDLRVEAAQLTAQAAVLRAATPVSGPRADAARMESRAQELGAAAATRRSDEMAHSFAGRLGRGIEPLFRPLGYDWKLSIGVVTSFAAREVFVSTMAIVTAGEDEATNENTIQKIATAKRDDGLTPIFTRATCWSLLVYYVLAMQCLPTLAVTAREAGGMKWAFLQLAWMSGWAYLAALVVYQLLK
jgi:ferrous iron transport protein B